ncbi:hypothetical protein NQ315_017455 [Exocentrus adspersus]|uniref:Uncharacterized protein n=1 Tax=Exocentrus adspersus TaxID=1586481 RepID=A0AAV8VKV3_9CUCU|nr:hypothetical protein NQ315_017455 [Exocentrus adspersus]
MINIGRSGSPWARHIDKSSFLIVPPQLWSQPTSTAWRRCGGVLLASSPTTHTRCRPRHNPLLPTDDSHGGLQREVAHMAQQDKDRKGSCPAELRRHTQRPDNTRTDRTDVLRPKPPTRLPRLTNPRQTLPDDVKQLIRDRRRLKRLATRTRLPQHRHGLNVLNRRVKAALNELTQESWAKHLESLDPQDNSLWKVQKALRLPARRKIPPIHGTRGVVYTNQEKAEAFADSLELQCTLPQLPDEDEEFETEVGARLLAAEEVIGARLLGAQEVIGND